MKRTEDVKNAMEKGFVRAFFQPQYNSVTNELVSAEALVRWLPREGGIIPPDEFIPEMERTGEVLSLDWFMVDEACRMLDRLFKENIRIPVAVNFSRWHVEEADFVEKLNEKLDGSSIPHKYIEVEITESALIKESGRIMDWAERVRENGYSVAIDDFGSGLSSLQFVKDIPADVLKIDRSLFSGNCENEKERIVLESIFSFAHRLQMVTVAEGVETKEQLGFLRTCSCRKIQGYLYAKPMDADAFVEECRRSFHKKDEVDILKSQTSSGAIQLLLDAVFQKYPLVIISNLTRNSYYMMAYDNYTSTGCPASGIFDELIVHGAASMHPEDREKFSAVFNREKLIDDYNNGAKKVSLVTRQLGDDRVYREVETTDFFVRHPLVDDIIVISLCDNK